MRPGILALTSTSFASTVPINLKSLGDRAVSKYQTSEPSVSSPRIMKTLLRAFIFPPKVQPISIHFGHGRIGKYPRGEFSAPLPIGKDRLPQKLHQSDAPLGQGLQ